MDIIRAFVLALLWFFISIGATYLLCWKVGQDWQIYKNPTFSTAYVESLENSTHSRRSGARYHYKVKIDDTLISHSTRTILPIGHNFSVVYSSISPSNFLIIDYLPNGIDFIKNYFGAELYRTGYAIFVPLSWLITIFLLRRVHILWIVPEVENHHG